jgi:hypothetical protein
VRRKQWQCVSICKCTDSRGVATYVRCLTNACVWQFKNSNKECMCVTLSMFNSNLLTTMPLPATNYKRGALIICTFPPGGTKPTGLMLQCQELKHLPGSLLAVLLTSTKTMTFHFNYLNCKDTSGIMQLLENSFTMTTIYHLKLYTYIHTNLIQTT